MLILLNEVVFCEKKPCKQPAANLSASSTVSKKHVGWSFILTQKRIFRGLRRVALLVSFTM